MESKRKSLKVTIENEFIFSDSLQHDVKADETTWTLEKGKTLTINLSKAGEIWWSKLLQNEGDFEDILSLNFNNFPGCDFKLIHSLELVITPWAPKWG